MTPTLLDFHNLGVEARCILETELHFQKAISSVYLRHFMMGLFIF